MTYTETIESIKLGLINYFTGTNPLVQTAQSTTVVVPQGGNMVIFAYSIEDIFEEVKKITSIRAKNIKNKDGKSMFEEYTMTDDEKGLFDTFCKNASVNLYSIFTAFCKKITPGYLYDKGELIPEFDPAIPYIVDKLVYYLGGIYKCIVPSTGILPSIINNWSPQPLFIDTKGKIIFVIDYDPEFKNAGIQLIESRIQNCFIWYVLAEWFKIVGLNEIAVTFISSYTDEKDNIRGNLFNLKITRRKYTEFPT